MVRLSRLRVSSIHCLHLTHAFHDSQIRKSTVSHYTSGPAQACCHGCVQSTLLLKKQWWRWWWRNQRININTNTHTNTYRPHRFISIGFRSRNVVMIPFPRTKRQTAKIKFRSPENVAKSLNATITKSRPPRYWDSIWQLACTHIFKGDKELVVRGNLLKLSRLA